MASSTDIPTSQNNPGDLKVGGTIATYKDPQEGYAALLNDLYAKQTGKTSTGLKPTSTLADFSGKYAPESDGNNPAQYTANLANQMGVAPDTQLKDLDLGKWADAVAKNEGYVPGGHGAPAPAPTANLASATVAPPSGGYAPPAAPGQTAPAQPAGSTGYAPPVPPPAPAQTETPAATPGADPSGGFFSGLQEDLSGTNPDNIGTQLENTAKSAGNFLFPAVGDIYNDLTGKNKKTALQQAGDVALTALPFIPGLGEAGEAARGAEVAGEGAEVAAKSGGLVGKLASLPTAVKGAGVGYGAGVASNLSQGQSIGQALTPNAANIGGAALGGAAPVALKALGDLRMNIAGITPQMENDLQSIGAGDSQGFQKYIDAGKARTKTSMAPSPINVAANVADQAATKIKSMLAQAGSAVGEANRAGEDVAVDPAKISTIAEAFNSGLEDRFGVKLGTNDDGTVSLIPTRRGGVNLSSSEESRIFEVAAKLKSLGDGGGNVREADDLMTTLDKNNGEYGVTGTDPLKGLFKQVRGQVNGAAREESPEFAAANDKSSALKGLLKETQAMAGKNTQRGELLMKRVFTGDFGQDTQKLFDNIKGATGIDLKKEALFAKYATDLFGNTDDKSRLEQIIGNAIDAHTGGIPLLSTALKAGAGAAKKTIANPVSIGRKLVNGKKNGVVGSLVTKGAARVGASL